VPPAGVLVLPSYVVKAAIADPRAKTFAAARMRAGGKAIRLRQGFGGQVAKGDAVFVLALGPPSRNSGGQGILRAPVRSTPH
jgi:hypothetical protein